MNKISASMALGVLVLNIGVAGATTLEDVRSSGVLQCGVDAASPGFSVRSESGQWSGLNVDFCRAVAAAVVGDANKVNFVALAGTEHIEVLQSGEIDVLATALKVSAQLEFDSDILFVEPLFYAADGKDVSAQAPAVRQGDDQWFTVVRWVRNQLVRQDMVAAAQVESSSGAALDLDPQWQMRVQTAIGSYGDMFTRNFGADAKRGLNALQQQGGLMWAPKF